MPKNPKKPRGKKEEGVGESGKKKRSRHGSLKKNLLLLRGCGEGKSPVDVEAHNSNNTMKRSPKDLNIRNPSIERRKWGKKC